MEEDFLLKLGGEAFYLDLNRISDFIKLDTENGLEDLLRPDDVEDDEENTEGELPETYGQMIDITKWEVTKAMVECILSEHGDLDEKMGWSKIETGLSIPFRISFNTLYINKILKRHG